MSTITSSACGKQYQRQMSVSLDAAGILLRLLVIEKTSLQMRLFTTRHSLNALPTRCAADRMFRWQTCFPWWCRAAGVREAGRPFGYKCVRVIKWSIYKQGGIVSSHGRGKAYLSCPLPASTAALDLMAAEYVGATNPICYFTKW